MRLEKIKLAGFKSFVDPTTLIMPGRLIGIVGPNGCGKSNIIDAIRFVIGESSAKHLRGNAMSDVIFTGSAARAPVALASVELIFDNSDGLAGGEFARYAQISVKRQVSREGQSQYFLNGSRCRRRDIMDLFLGTGLGPRSYAIIEQGMVSRFIEARPEDLRLFIEEAAGLSKYKERRRETEIKMEHTRANLERVADIRSELQTQVSRLARQAKKAEKFRELERQITVCRHQLIAMQWQEADDAYRRKQAGLNALERQLKAREAQWLLSRKSVARARDEVESLEKQLQQMQARLYQLNADISRCDQTIKHAEQSRRQREQTLREWRRELERAHATLEQDKEQLVHLERQQRQLQSELTEARNQADKDQAKQQQVESTWQQLRRQSDQCRDRLRRMEEDERLLQLEIQHHRQRQDDMQCRIEALAAQKARLSAEIQTLDSRDPEKELDRVKAHHQTLQKRLQRLTEIRQQLQNDRQQRQRQQEQLASQIHRLEGQISGLETLQHHALGKDRQRLQQWLAQHGLQSLPRLVETLTVEDGWEMAVESALGQWLQALCSPQLPTGIGDAPERIAFVSDMALYNLPRDSLAHKIASGRAAVPLLSRYRCIADVTAALSRRNELAHYECWITPDGDQIGPNRLFVNRTRSQEQGILTRQKALREHQARLQELQRQQASLQQSLTQLSEQLKHATTELDSLRAEERDCHAALVRLQAELQSVRQRRRETQNRLDQLDRELEAGIQEQQRLQETIEQLHSRREQKQQAVKALLATSKKLSREVEQAGSENDKAGQQLRQSREKVTRLETALEHTDHAIALLKKQLRRTEQQCQELESRLQQTQKEQDRNVPPLQRHRQELETLLQQRPALEAELAATRKQLQQAVDRLRQLEGLRQQHETAREQARESLEAARLAAEAARVRFETVQEQVRDARIDLAQTFQSLPRAAEPAAWQRQLDQLQKEQARLGDVNFAAIEEHRLQSERLRFLDKQCQDLENALALLEKAIRTIDRETRTRFRETFAAINGHFQERFPALFGGGEARLELTEDDLLSAGVRIMARPPGKRNSSIHLLSGGEKAMTAIALVFSFFELNPAPFCILDEVDAPLDDANVDRYCQLLQSMAERVQFLFVTHNKITMEIADQLIGVTMREPGVSRIVAVDLQQAAEMAG